jgi:hypothetical protein
MLKGVIIVKIDDFEQKAQGALLRCFQDIPFLDVINVDAEPNREGRRPDIRIALQFQEQVRYVIAELKNNGEPRYARQAVNQMLNYLRESRCDYGVFVAPYISSRAAAICQEKSIGYIDFAGNCHLSFENIYVHKEGTPNPFTRKRYLRSMFSPKAERILRVLLTSGPREWKVEELALEADVSLGQVSNVKKLLADQEWIDKKAVGFSLIDPFSLLEEWSQNYKYRRNKVRNFYTMLGIAEFEYKFGEICQRENLQYGFTGFSGSSRYAPAVRYQRVMAYVQDEIDELIKILDIKPVDSGANVLLLEPYDDGVFYGKQEREGSMVVSPIQIYLDLYSYRGRGEEAAEILLGKVIRKLW